MASMAKGTRWLLGAMGSVALLALLLAGAAWLWLDRPLTLAAPAVELSIEPGSTPREVAQA